MATPEIALNALPSEPTMKDLIDLAKKDVMLSLNCHAVATIQSINFAEQTATATINYTKTFFEKSGKQGKYKAVQKEYPILMDCPLLVLGGGPAALTFPIAAGDECLVFFNDRDLDNWFQGGAGSAVASSRLHSFSDGIILVGLRSKANALEGYDGTRACLRGNASGTTLVGVGEEKILIANSGATLNDLLQELIGELSDLVQQITLLTVTCAAPGNPSSPPINAPAITLIGNQITVTKNKIGELLE